MKPLNSSYYSNYLIWLKSKIIELVSLNQNTADDRFNYMLLDRLRCDCEYYFGYGSRNANHSLWAHDEQKQIDKMREFYDLLSIKSEWFTREQIDKYAAQMGAK